jgi:nucleoside-diphosphate-sugar epimerase
MRAKRILVTGATGFAGGHLCERLVKEGYAVRALVRDPSRGAELAHWSVELAIGDLRDRESVARAMEGIDLVYHLAAVFRSENVWRQEMWETNVRGTENLLDASIKHGVQRFVHCSTVGVHGDIKTPPANEDTPYGPGDHYQESKTEAERLVRYYMAEGRLPIVVFRPGGIYGPRDTRFLKLIKAVKQRRFIMLGTGKVLYQMIYVDDLIDGILRCGTENHAIGNVYILTGEEAVTLNQLVQVIAEVVGVSASKLRFPVAPVYVAGFLCELLCKPFGINPPLYRRRVDFFRKSRSFDISKARRELKFQPRMTLKAGIRHTVDWYRQENML